MLRPHGYVTVTSAMGRVIEHDAITCRHCQRVILVKPGTLSTVYLFPQLDGSMLEEPGAGCHRCGGAICLQCYDSGACSPAEKRIELMEAIGRRG